MSPLAGGGQPGGTGSASYRLPASCQPRCDPGCPAHTCEVDGWRGTRSPVRWQKEQHCCEVPESFRSQTEDNDPNSAQTMPPSAALTRADAERRVCLALRAWLGVSPPHLNRGTLALKWKLLGAQAACCQPRATAQATQLSPRGTEGRVCGPPKGRAVWEMSD